MIRVGSDFSGVGAFNQALTRLGINYEEVFACDMDKYARQTFILNYGEPKYFPTNVYERAIPSEPLDIYMTSPPCQAFSLAGKRLGKDDKRGILFFNSHEFIQVNKPRYFIFENVKGLLSDDNGKTFQEWINLLGGKSVNGLPIIFPDTDSVSYHIYWKVLNAKDYGVPQNRERVFIIGIRDDADNNFRFPIEEHLSKRLKDVLENEVDDKYFLNEKMINVLSHHKNQIIENETPKNSACIHAGYFIMGGRNQQYLKVTNFQGNDISNTIRTGGKGSMSNKHNWDTIKIKSATGKGFREIEDVNCQTIAAMAREDENGQPVIMQINSSLESGGKQPYQQNRIYDSSGLCPALNAGQMSWGGNAITLPNKYKIRRLTPRECFRLMDFPDTFVWDVSDSQAYKQAGNSIVVNVLAKIIERLKL